mmetsp:Transcript_10252/g.34845  ORF Transcript_10252/g.34845 Transcript_10252/m.34845 type:complete len:404 (+) Transcript_10252:44-1255(+)
MSDGASAASAHGRRAVGRVRALQQGGEDAPVPAAELLGRPALHDGPLGEHDDRVGAHDSHQAVRNSNRGLVRHVLAEGLLDQHVRLVVDGRRGLVEHQHAGRPQEGATEAQQLPLAHAEVAAPGGHRHREAVHVGGHDGRQVAPAEGCPHLLVRVLVKGVQVGAHRAREEHGVLRDDGERLAQRAQVEAGRVDAVDADAPRAQGHHAIQREQEGGLPRARAPHDAHLGARGDLAVEVVEHEGQVRPVAHADVVEGDHARGRPPGGRLERERRGGLLGRELAVAVEALHAHHLGLQRGEHADEPVEVVREHQRVRERQPGDARGHASCARLIHEKDRRQADECVADELEAHGEPAVGREGEEGGAEVVVEARRGGVQEAARLVEGQDGGHPCEGLRKGRVDGRL